MDRLSSILTARARNAKRCGGKAESDTPALEDKEDFRLFYPRWRGPRGAFCGSKLNNKMPAACALGS